jgi:amidase
LVPLDAVGDTFLATMATEGPMARTVEDIARLLEVQAGVNPEVPFGREGAPFGDLLDVDMRGKRIGWLGDWGGAYGCEPGILELCEAGLRVFEGMGAVVEPVAPPFPAEKLWFAWTTIRAMLNAGDKQAMAADPVKRALIKPESLWEIEQGTKVTTAEFHAASVIRSRWYARVAKLFGDYDALVMPTAQVWPFPVEWRWPERIGERVMDTYHRWMEVVIPVSLAGLPSLNVPVGFGAQGLPMGMQLFGPFGADAKVLAMGQQYHLATDWPGRRMPDL